MTSTDTRYPSTISQTTGGHNAIFQDLNNLKSSGGYARSKNPIQSKKATSYNPSNLTLTNFKFKIPSNAYVRKVTVEVEHYKRGCCGTSQDKYPCDTAKNVMSIPAPTIKLTHTSDSIYRNMLEKVKDKIGAPTKTSKKHTLSLKCNLPAEAFNSNNFGVWLGYGENTNTYEGYLYIKYVRVKLEYVTPSYVVSLQKVAGGYNGDDYKIKATVTDNNKVIRPCPAITITAPTGFNFKSASGGGTVTQTQDHVVKWQTVPLANHKFTDSVELVYDTRITGSLPASFTFQIAVTSTGVKSTHTATITVKPPIPSTDTDDDTDGQSSSNDDTIPINFITKTKKPYVQLDLTQEELDRLVTEDGKKHTAYVIISNPGFQKEIVNPLPVETVAVWNGPNLHDVTDITNGGQIRLTDIPENTTGEYTIIFYYLMSIDEDYYFSWNRIYHFARRPNISEDTVNMTLFDLSNEELNRLGDGYNYQVQSDLKLATSEYYVRDWPKNFKLLIFNNRIEENCSSCIHLTSDDDIISNEFQFPINPNYGLDVAELKLEVDNSVKLQTGIVDDEPVYTTITSEHSITPVTDYNIPLTFKKVSNNEINLTATLIFWRNQQHTYSEYYEVNYLLKFNQEEAKPPEEVITDTTDYDNLSTDDILANAMYKSTQTAGLNAYNNVLCEFTYDKDYPLYILITGDYVTKGDPVNNTIKFTEPCIVESDGYTERVTNGHYPVPIDNLVLTDGSVANTELAGFQKTENIILYDFPLDEDYGTNSDMAIRGIELTGDIEYTDELSISANLKSPTGESKTRSLILEETDHSFSIGGMGDLWGFSTLDLVNLDEWECEIFINNTLNDKDSITTLGALTLIFYVEEVEKQNITCKIEGEDIGYYGVFIQNVTIPEGLETNTAYLKVDGTDTNDAYRQNIKEKEITIEGEIGDNCDLEMATYSLREFTKLLVNDRDEYNRPIPKTIEFSHYPDVYWEYIMEEALDTEIEISSYTFKAKLTIPAGTSYDKVPTSTSSNGYVNGIANVNPVITVKPTASAISITETVTNQKFSMAYPQEEWADKIIEIHTDDRKVYLKTDEDDTDETDITAYTDYNCDWFVLKGEYAFEGTNCIIRTCTYEERW